MHVCPEGREEQRIAGDGLYPQILPMEARLPATCHGVQVDDHGQLPLPRAGTESIEVPLKLAFILEVMLDLVTAAAQWPHLQRGKLGDDTVDDTADRAMQLAMQRIPGAGRLDSEIGADFHLVAGLALTTRVDGVAAVFAAILRVGVDDLPAQLLRQELLDIEDAFGGGDEFHTGASTANVNVST